MESVIVTPSGVSRWLGGIAAALVAGSVVSRLVLGPATAEGAWSLVRFLSLEYEHNLPAIFSVVLLVFAAQAVAMMAAAVRRSGGPHAISWTVLCCGFGLMAVDEGLSLHEWLVVPVRRMLGRSELGVFYYAWVIPGIVVALACWAFFIPLLRSVPGWLRRRLLLAGAVYLTGAIGFEMLGGWHAERYGTADNGFLLLVTLEESFEMAGVIFFINTVLRAVAAREAVLRFSERGDGPAKGRARRTA